MKILGQNHIVKVEYDEKNSLFKHTWNDQTEAMTNEEYKKLVLWVNNLAYQVDASFHLVNTSEFNFSISPDVQEWVASHVFPMIAEKDVKKIAFIISKDLFSQISIEQFVEENKQAAVKVLYFDNEELALKWLFED
ncbi:MAG: hypothetical protein EAZ55_12110 [Cytophagales bacterium]|nr:MAG: hypothetical protein EAZ55_12110 [Cytophagales bacterium]